MNPKVAYINALILKGDLQHFDQEFRQESRNLASFFNRVRGVLVCLTNLEDLRRAAGPLLIGEAELAGRGRDLSRRVEVVRRLRNSLAGHICADVVLAAVREEPILFGDGMPEESVLELARIRLVEAAFNTLVDAAGVPLVFGGDTDLVYPPDMKRLLDWLEELIVDSVAYLDLLLAHLRGGIASVKTFADLMEQYQRVGLGTFEP